MANKYLLTYLCWESSHALGFTFTSDLCPIEPRVFCFLTWPKFTQSQSFSRLRLYFISFLFGCMHLHLHCQMIFHVLLFNASDRRDMLTMNWMYWMMYFLCRYCYHWYHASSFLDVVFDFFDNLFPSKLILTLSLPSSFSPF